MCLCNNPDGGLLVHRGPTTSCDSSPPSPSLPLIWHHGVQRCMSNHCTGLRASLSKCLCSHMTSVNAHTTSLLIVPGVPGLYAVPEGHKPAVCGGADGCSGRGTVEFAQTHRFEGVALCWCASSTVSGSHSPTAASARLN